MTNRLIPTNAEPLYRQLMARIRDDVSSGVYPAESQIPSEQEMCARYGVSRVTVRRAISELTDEGILRKQQGKGTFVCTPKLCRDLRDINSFHECCRMQGVTPGTRLIHAQLSHADERTQRELELPDDRVVEIERVDGRRRAGDAGNEQFPVGVQRPAASGFEPIALRSIGRERHYAQARDSRNQPALRDERTGAFAGS